VKVQAGRRRFSVVVYPFFLFFRGSGCFSSGFISAKCREMATKPSLREEQGEALHRLSKRITSSTGGQDEASTSCRSCRVSQEPQKFSRLGAKIPRRAPGRHARDRKHFSPSDRGRSKRRFLPYVRLGFCRDVRGVGASRVRDLSSRAASRALSFSSMSWTPWAHPGAGTAAVRRARADAQPDARGDGRFDTKDGSSYWRPPTALTSWYPALLRPGRFDRQVVVDMPDVQGA